MQRPPSTPGRAQKSPSSLLVDLCNPTNSPNTNTPPQLINTFGLMIVVIVALKSPKLMNVNRRRSRERRQLEEENQGRIQ